ncbi:MAG: VanZ family protein [Spirochaetaceae bacterium]|nr:VanZ family protein [Spirochaetaceae bacterium]
MIVDKQTVLRLLLKLSTILIAAAIWLLSSQSTLPQVKGVFGFDKVQHMIAFAVLAGCAALWFSPKRLRERPFVTALIAALIACGYGAADEIHQYFVPGRDCNVWDWIADTIGAFAGSGAVVWGMRGLLGGFIGKKVDSAV